MTWLKHSLPIPATLAALCAVALYCPGCGGNVTESAGILPAPVNDGEINANRSGAVPGAGLARSAIQTGSTDAAATGEIDLAILQEQLAAELERLGKDPSNTVSTAPTGADNAVFDLSAEIVDPDGAGGDPPTSITLAWTEQLCGDYDQNGLVNASDLTPLGVYWEDTIAYDDSSLHGGFKYWPEGDPDGAGADNWRLARVDGNRDGQVYQYDITPIAVHWEERLSHYRVYVKAPGESSYTVVQALEPQRNGSDPVRYFFEAPVAGDGVYEYYVAPYDGSSDTEGLPSSVISVNVDTGDVNHAPVAVLKATPDSGGTPAVITLDASQSYDVDGDEIYDIYWDLDNDAQTDPDNHDFKSRDAIAPEASSSGAVIDIEPVAPDAEQIVTKLNCTYIQPHGTPEEPEYWYPYISVIDEHGLAGGGYAKLGISGWVTTVLNESFENYLMPFDMSVTSIDPATGEAVLATSYVNNQLPEFAVPSMWIARENDGERWTMEAVTTFVSGSMGITWGIPWGIAWDEYGQPIIILTWDPDEAGYESLWSAHRQSDGTWNLEELFSPGPPELKDNLVAFYRITQRQNGVFAGRICETLKDKNSIFGTLGHQRHHLLFYDYGGWRIEYTGYDTAEVPEYASSIAFNTESELIGLFRVTENTPGGIWMADWQDAAGFATPMRIDDGSLGFSQIYTKCSDALIEDDGTLHALYVDSQRRERWYVEVNTSGETYAEEMIPLPPYNMVEFQGNLHLIPDGAGYFLRHYDTVGSAGYMVEYVRREGSQVIREQIIPRVTDYPKRPSIVSTVKRPDGRTAAFLRHEIAGDPYESDFTYVYRLAERVDPSLWE